MPQSSNMTLDQAVEFIGNYRAYLGATQGFEKLAEGSILDSLKGGLSTLSSNIPKWGNLSPELRNSLIGGGLGLGAGVIGTAMSKKKKKQYLRNALLSSLLGAGVGGLGTLAMNQGGKLMAANSTGAPGEESLSPAMKALGTMRDNTVGSEGAMQNSALLTGAGVAAGDMYDKRRSPHTKARQTIRNVNNNFDSAKQRMPGLAEQIAASNPGKGGTGSKPLQSPTVTVPHTGGKVKGKFNIAGGMRNRPMTFQQHTGTSGATPPRTFQPTPGQQQALNTFNKSMPLRVRALQSLSRNKGKLGAGAAGFLTNAAIGNFMQDLDE